MNKRGQFYLIIVIILALTIYGITYQVNTIQESPTFEDFEDISQNYVTESKKIVNNALKEGVNPLAEEQLPTFTTSFLTYAKSRDPNLDLLYIYRDDLSEQRQIILKNYFDQSMSIDKEITIPGADEELFQRIVIQIGGTNYTHQIPVAVGEFGSNWYTAEELPSQFDLSIGGVIHPFDLSQTSSEFKVIIQSQSGTYTQVMNE